MKRPANGPLRKNTCQCYCYLFITADPQFTFRGKKCSCAAVWADFSKLPTQPEISCGNVSFLTFKFAWRQVWGGLCGNEDLQKPLLRYSLTNLHGSRCAPKASSGGTTRAAAQPGRLSRRWGPLAHNQAHWASSSPGQVQIRVAPCMQAEAPAHVAHTTQQAASSGSEEARISRRGQSAKRLGVQADPRPFLDWSVNVAASQTHVFKKIYFPPVPLQ